MSPFIEVCINSPFMFWTCKTRRSRHRSVPHAPQLTRQANGRTAKRCQTRAAEARNGRRRTGVKRVPRRSNGCRECAKRVPNGCQTEVPGWCRGGAKEVPNGCRGEREAGREGGEAWQQHAEGREVEEEAGRKAEPCSRPSGS
eukprot:1913611-Rhodomonas_salina.1